MGQKAEEAISQLRAEREETLRALLTLSEEECRLPAQWAGAQRTVNFLLRAFSNHYLDHLQHINKMLREQQRFFTEPQVLLIKAQALFGEFEAMVRSLSDEEITRPTISEEGWSIQQVIEHLAEIERTYRSEILRQVEAARGRAAG